MMLLLIVPIALLLAVLAALVIFTAVVARQAVRLVPRRGRFIVVDGVRLNYLDEGTGPVVLLIHGLASQLQTFTFAMQARLQGRYRLVMLDRPGSGYSQAAPQATLAAQSALISAFLRALAIERAVVVGHSLGGVVALTLALDHPEQVAGLVLLASVTQPQAEPPQALVRLAVRSDVMRWLTGWTIAVPIAIRSQAATLRALFSPDPAPLDFGTRGGSLLVTRPGAYRNACRDLVEVGGDLAEVAARYGTLRMPVGMLFGTGDKILDSAIHATGLQKQLPDLDLELIDGGHMLPLTAPDQCIALIDRIFARSDLAGEPAIR